MSRSDAVTDHAELEPDHRDDPGAGHGTRTVLAALTANLGIAVAKFVGFLATGSSAMVAEAVHSMADSGNQALLLVGRRRAGRGADRAHPFGYGQDRYFYAFVVALVIFALGSLFALYEGVQKLNHPHEIERPQVALIILGAAVVMEGLSIRTAIRESKPHRRGATWFGYIRRAKSPEIPVVLMEDSAALIGLFFAGFGVGMSALTGNSRWDAVGSLGIGVLLAVVSVVLIVETKSLLIGEGASPRVVERIEEALVGPGVERVIHLRTLHLGPDELLVAAKLAMPKGAGLAAVATAIDDAERRVRAVVRSVRAVIYLEPDIDRAAIPPGPAE